MPSLSFGSGFICILEASLTEKSRSTIIAEIESVIPKTIVGQRSAPRVPVAVSDLGVGGTMACVAYEPTLRASRSKT